MSELNFKSISELPLAESVSENDYILTVQGGSGKRLPTGSFPTGAKVTVFNIATANDNTNYFEDSDGNRVSDLSVLTNAFMEGKLILKYGDILSLDWILLEVFRIQMQDGDFYIDISANKPMSWYISPNGSFTVRWV